jgi:hypothetical protein
MGWCDESTTEPPASKKRKKSKPRKLGHRIVAPRSRERTDCVPGIFTVTHPLALPTPHVEFRNVTYGTRYETMSDVIGLQQMWFNPVFHEKVTWDPFNVYNVTDSISGDDVLTFSTGTVSFLDEIRQNMPTPPVDTIDDLAAKSLDHFTTAVDSSHSLLNFIIELIQVLEGNIKNLQKARSLINAAMEAFRKAYAKAKRDGLSETASYWLAWNFAIKPTLKDIKAILCAVSQARKRLDWLRKQNGKPTYIKWGAKDFYTPDVFPEIMIDWFPEYRLGRGALAFSESWIRIRCVHYQIDYNSTGLVRFDIPAYLLEGIPGLGTVWAAYSGLYNPLKVIWEMIPFSWLVDWFMSYRTKLQAKLGDWSPLKDAEVIDSGHSFKTRSEWIVEQTRDGGISWLFLSKVKYSAYIRHPGLPEVQSSPFRVPLEWYNVSILLSIVRQWWTRRR